MTFTRRKSCTDTVSIWGISRRRWHHLLVLILVAYPFRHAVNPDGIAYLQIARHFVNLDLDLAISGYWGPLLSGIFCPFLALDVPPLVTARIVMAISTLFFLESSRELVQASSLPKKVGQWLDGALFLTSLLWSVENISPDLLLAGIYLRILHGVMMNRWTYVPRSAMSLGFWCALAYLTKSVALPVTVLFVCLSLGATWIFRSSRRLPSRSCAGLMLLSWGIPCIIWISVLSMHYGKFTFSTSARIVHATTGPGDVQRYPIGFNIAPPENGRITTWENPSLNPEQYWSPFESKENLQHQLELIVSNLPKAALVLTSVFFWSIPTLFILTGTLRSRLSRTTWFEPKYWRAAVVLSFFVANFAVYTATLLPVTEQRYFYAFAPIMALVILECRPPLNWIQKHKVQFLAIILGLGLVGLSIARWAILPSISLSAFHIAYETSLAISRDADVKPGPVVGNARLPRGRAGLYLAYFLDQPWYGGNPTASTDDLAQSGAHFLALSYDDHRIPTIESDPRFQRIPLEGITYIRLYSILRQSPGP